MSLQESSPLGTGSTAGRPEAPLSEPGQGGASVNLSLRPRSTPCDVTRVFPPLPAQPIAISRRKPGGLKTGYADVTPYEVPGAYGDNRVVAMVRDPNWLFAYWEINEGVRQRIQREYGVAVFKQSSLVIRVHDVTGLDFDGTNAWRSFDVGVGGDYGNWYVHVPESDRSYCLDLGLIAPDGRFILLARSNVVTTPRAGLSPLSDEEWLTIEEIYGMSVGIPEPLSSAALMQVIARRLAEQVGSGAVSSISSPWMVGQPPVAPFWLTIETELIVRVATRPGAEVTLGGQRVELSADGKFSARMPLTEGDHLFPVVATSPETGQVLKGTPRVVRSTVNP